ncbi:hypothetical protein KJ039_09005 [bacterium]|nr:hypothetical protein [bacterium]
MPLILTDNEILQFIQEEKALPREYNSLFQMKEKKGHREQELTIRRTDGSLFKLILRQNRINVLDFSVILGYMPPQSNIVFRLRRYNGKSHEHTNIIEKAAFYDFHVHTATSRYQEAGLREDGFAEASGAYADIHGAMECFIRDCNLTLPDNKQIKLF